jgi:tRNA A-37 threonylcarbamoyl transferase component Bud32
MPPLTGGIFCLYNSMQTLVQLRNGEYKGQTSLKLSCELKEFPEEIFELADTLEILDLSGNLLSELPSNFGDLKNLKIAFFSNNEFTKLPEVLANCPKLEMIGFKSNRINNVPEDSLPPTTRWLILTNNQISKIPSSIGKCKPLQKVAFAGNQLSELPIEMANCTNLELLRISANKFRELPEWLLQMPKLAWLAFSGNPLNKNFTHTNGLQTFQWNDFEILELIGEGASGHIYKAANKTNANKHYAIKLFKGEVTSDGFSEDEMNANLLAGTHSNLVEVIGVITNHPQNKNALVMELIPNNFKNLGQPPSFKTCTRDTFISGTQFSLEQILNISHGLAKAILHLHTKGILHGDLYAHNTLVSDNNDVLTGDFGAASLFNVDSHQGYQLQKIESRAFGCFLEDLLSLVSEKEKANEIYFQLLKLKTDCLLDVILNRPSFIDIEQRLKSMF